MVDRREILIDGRVMEVVDIEKYAKNPEGYLNGYVAVDIGQDTVFPVLPANSKSPGITIKRNCPILYANVPTGETAEQYKKKNMIDYSKSSTFKEFAEKQDMVREIEKDILTSPDNIYVPPRDENDSDAMKALKDAVEMKHIDLDKYEPRFGSNYNNDKRIFNKSTISLAMLMRMCNALDIKASLTLEDQTPMEGQEIPNPMGNSITVELTSGNNED